MKKTMYTAMRNFAVYIAESEQTDFEFLWNEWSAKYNPSDDTVQSLKKMGQQLCLLNKADIKNVPETRYTKIVSNIVNKHNEEKENGNV